MGIPATVEKRGRGTMVSPCPPRTKAWVFSTDTFSSMAMNARKRAESSTPAMPMTRFLGNPLASRATWHMASSGLLTMIRVLSGATAAISRTTFSMIPMLVERRSSRLMPGFRGIPAVMITMSDPAASLVIPGGPQNP